MRFDELLCLIGPIMYTQISIKQIISDPKSLESNKQAGNTLIAQLHDERKLNIDNSFKHLNMLIDLVMPRVKPRFAYAQCEN